ncbi:hypothetical protein Z042_03705 [Chania multitudinisentens RB-25]|uniref:DUF2946 domain-containing protein n=1 Tax=Chania multitudinisentens RB-25 TaxID=1441930 RepID=W0L953_9GAMM|nr:hypothetical protein [Chania multitudinisentens]AHG18812.1 hypothetical protein Z042_03705 [Chania multitudinisentens RB-25]
MSALASLCLSMHRLRCAKKRAGVWLLGVCWLLLNSQLAIASHNCNLQFAAEAPAAQHMTHMQTSDSAQGNMQAEGPLCEQHCIPDPVQQDHGNLALAAILPASSELLVAVPAQPGQLSRADWQTPPIAGPPAEIVFCRFRE